MVYVFRYRPSTKMCAPDCFQLSIFVCVLQDGLHTKPWTCKTIFMCTSAAYIVICNEFFFHQRCVLCNKHAGTLRQSWHSLSVDWKVRVPPINNFHQLVCNTLLLQKAHIFISYSSRICQIISFSALASNAISRFGHFLRISVACGHLIRRYDCNMHPIQNLTTFCHQTRFSCQWYHSNSLVVLLALCTNLVFIHLQKQI